MTSDDHSLGSSDIAFYSFSYKHETPEHWFTDEHSHDLGPIKNNKVYRWIHGPSINYYVKRTNIIQTERGIKSVVINATNYKSDKELTLYVVSEQW